MHNVKKEERTGNCNDKYPLQKVQLFLQHIIWFSMYVL